MTTESPSVPAENISAISTSVPAKSERLDSLDALRGFDLFVLTILGPIVHVMYYSKLIPREIWHPFSHVSWGGFNCWDMVMPLFVFMAGVSIPFAMSKYVRGNAPLQKSHAYIRILKRVIILWILGMIAQGNLLDFNLETLKPVTNTLQTIAIGYAGATILFLNTKLRTQLIVAGTLLFVSWLLCTIFGDWNPNTNLPERIDKFILGKWTDGARVGADGNVIFAPWFHYSWFFAGMNFIVTVLTGVFAGVILKCKTHTLAKKFFLLAGTGIALVTIGWTLDFCGIAPVIKTIWTSSMVLVTSGYGFLLMAAFFGVMDWAGFKRGSGLLKVIGVNSILAYMLSPEVGLISFGSISEPVLHGFAQFMTPEWFQALVSCGNALLLLLVLWLFKRAGIFLKA